MAFSFNTASTSEVTVETCPSKWEGLPPVYLPTRELLTIYPGFVSLYETTIATWPRRRSDAERCCWRFPRPINLAVVLQRLKQLIKAIDPHPRVVEMAAMPGIPWTVS